LDERTFFCPACEHTWCIDGRSPHAAPQALPVETAPTVVSDRGGENARLRAIVERLGGTLRRAATVLEISRALHVLSQHRRHLRHLARLALRPQ
jgi:hypothetical protein